MKTFLLLTLLSFNSFSSQFGSPISDWQDLNPKTSSQKITDGKIRKVGNMSEIQKLKGQILDNSCTEITFNKSKLKAIPLLKVSSKAFSKKPVVVGVACVEGQKICNQVIIKDDSLYIVVDNFVNQGIHFIASASFFSN